MVEPRLTGPYVSVDLSGSQIHVSEDFTISFECLLCVESPKLHLILLVIKIHTQISRAYYIRKQLHSTWVNHAPVHPKHTAGNATRSHKFYLCNFYSYPGVWEHGGSSKFHICQLKEYIKFLIDSKCINPIFL